MLREGPIPKVVHGAFEYLLGVLFLAAPILFDFDSERRPACPSPSASSF